MYPVVFRRLGPEMAARGAEPRLDGARKRSEPVPRKSSTANPSKTWRRRGFRSSTPSPAPRAVRPGLIVTAKPKGRSLNGLLGKNCVVFPYLSSIIIKVA